MRISRAFFWLVLIALLTAILAFIANDRSEMRARVASNAQPSATGGFNVDVAAMDCPTPFADQAHPASPLQGRTNALPETFQLKNGAAHPLATFAVEGRVLGRKDYESDREARFAPTDIAFGWSRMRDPAVISKLNITQSSRWYRYNWSGDPPIPVNEIVRSSANMHMIPANEQIAKALGNAQRSDIVRVDGFLVSVEDGKGWRWQSSMTREDSGAGACEVVYVCRVRVTSSSVSNLQ